MSDSVKTDNPIHNDSRLGVLAINAGLATEEQVDECLNIQFQVRAAGQDSKIGKILVKKGYLTLEQVGKLLARQRRLRVTGGIRRTALQAAPVDSEEKKNQYKRLGAYPLIAEIGRGSMGAVYLSENPRTGERVAIKILPKKLAEDKEYLERFKREAKMCMQLNHENIVKGLDMGFDRGYHYMVLEYVDGPSLDKRLKNGGKLDYEEALFIVRGVADGLKEARKHGIIHRDIKPDNILIAGDGTPKLTDLGLSLAKKSGDERLTMAGMAVGTPYYISPEQARGERDVDTRSDIYSLGASLYHLVTGQYPFEAKTSVQIMLSHINEAITLPSKVNPDLPPELDVLVSRMMEKDPVDRYQTPAELVDAIDCVIRGERPPDKRGKTLARTQHHSRTRRVNSRTRTRKNKKGRKKSMATMVAFLIIVIILVIISVVVLATMGQ